MMLFSSREIFAKFVFIEGLDVLLSRIALGVL